MATGTGALNPMEAFAIVGIAGVGAQWLAWRFRMPGIVLMLAAGLILGPVTGIFVPERDIGDLVRPMISLAVAVILFEGGLTLNFQQLGDARPVVGRLVFPGALLGWMFSALALNLVAGLGWEASIVFGGI
ncbi:MAG TPA: cation:proton antiporter, partial [Paracoccus sp. (in: a-proteobacteria)]|nr:cation:proton antiporter [Paracoccus sp. (in: a-proteobacteria)]